MVKLTVLTAEDKRRIKQQLARDRLQSSGYTAPTGLTPAQQKAQRDYYNKLKKRQDDFQALQEFRKKTKAIADAKKKLDQEMRDRLLEYERTTSGLLPSEERAIKNMTTEQLKASIKRMEAIQEAEEPEEPEEPEQPTRRRQVDDTDEQTSHHPEIDKTKAIELLELSADSYKEGDKVDDGILIEETKNLFDTQVVVYSRQGYKVVAFRGTWENIDWLANINTTTVKLSSIFKFIEDNEDIIVHSGFAKAVLPVYQKIKDQLKGSEIYDLTGHSQGAMLSNIFGYVYALDTGITPRFFYTFGSPRGIVDDAKYPAKRYDDLMEMVRFQNDNDLVTYYPHKGNTQDIAKHSTAGGIIGGTLGGITGATVGATIGGVLGVAGGGYKHIGTGVMLFDPDIENVVTINNKTRILENRNYYLVKEGVDILKDPLDEKSSIRESLVMILGGKVGFESIKSASLTAEYQDFIIKSGKDSVFTRIKNIFNMNFYDYLSSEIVQRMADSRKSNLRSMPFSSIAIKDTQGTIWTNTAQYLTGELLEKFNQERGGLRQMRVNIRERASGGLDPLARFGFFKGRLPNENLDSYYQAYKEIVEFYLNEQLKLDTKKAKDFYKFIGLGIFAETLLYYKVFSDLLFKVQGHTTTEYRRRLEKLPNTIYEGFTDTDEIIVNNDKFTKQMKNLYIRNNDPNDKYYLNHSGGKSELRKMENRILGYFFYNPKEETQYLNKLVVF